MKRILGDYEYEIINQILIAEICFDSCKEIPVISGLGAHLYPYFFNLSMSKGILSLHSLLYPTGKELSMRNYLAENKYVLSKRIDYQNLINNISKITSDFQKITPWLLRHKVVAHLDPKFKHSDFVSAYLASDYLDAFINITNDLKNAFLKFCNYAEQDYPFLQIRNQVKSMVEKIQAKHE